MSYILRKGHASLGDLSDGLDAILPVGHGNVYYVNGSGSVVGCAITGSDQNPGTLKEPFATITYALSKCTNDQNDVIVVTDYYQPSGETWPISVNKSLVSIIGLPRFGGGPFAGYCPWVVGVVPTASSCAFFDIVANNVLISGFGMYAASSTFSCITFDEGACGVQIHDCRFNRGSYGVYSDSTHNGGYGMEIINCWFQNGLGAGIYIGDNPPHCIVRGNYFDAVTGVAIHIAGAPASWVIEGNRIHLASGYSAGAGITIVGGSRHFIHDNYAYIAHVSGSSGNNPFVDASDCGNWGPNYYGVTLTQPA